MLFQFAEFSSKVRDHYICVFDLCLVLDLWISFRTRFLAWGCLGLCISQSACSPTAARPVTAGLPVKRPSYDCATPGCFNTDPLSGLSFISIPGCARHSGRKTLIPAVAGHAFSSVSTTKEVCRDQTSVYYIFVARVVGREGAVEEVRSREFSSEEGDC